MIKLLFMVILFHFSSQIDPSENPLNDTAPSFEPNQKSKATVRFYRHPIRILSTSYPNSNLYPVLRTPQNQLPQIQPAPENRPMNLMRQPPNPSFIREDPRNVDKNQNQPIDIRLSPQIGPESSLMSGITAPTVNMPNIASILIPPPTQTQVQPQGGNNQPVLARNPNLFFPNSGPRFFEIDSEPCTFGWCGNECCPKMTTIEASPIPGSYSPPHPIVLVLHPSNAQRCSPMCQPQCSPQCLARLQYSAMPINTPPHSIRPPIHFPSQQQLQCRSDCMPSCHVDCLILPPTILECPKWQCFCPSGYIRCSISACCNQYQNLISKFRNELNVSEKTLLQSNEKTQIEDNLINQSREDRENHEDLERAAIQIPLHTQRMPPKVAFSEKTHKILQNGIAEGKICIEFQEAPSKKVEIRKETKNCGKIKKNSQSESNEDRSTAKPEEATRKEEFSEEVDEFKKETDQSDKNDKEQFEIESERRKIVEGEIMIPTTDLPRQITIPMSAPTALRLPPRTTPVPTLIPIYPEPSGNSLGERSKSSYNLWQYRSSTPTPPTNLKSEPELPLLRAVPNSKQSLRSRPFINVLAELTKLSPKREFFSFKEAKNYLNLLSLQTA